MPIRMGISLAIPEIGKAKGGASGGAAAPVLSSPTATDIDQTTASGTVSTNQAGGQLYWICTVNNSAPSAAQIVLGLDGTAAPAAASGHQAVASTGLQNISISGLTASTT